MTRVATYSNHTLLSDLALRNASNVTNLNNQASSGYKSRDYAGIADSTQRLLNLEGDVTRIDQFLKNSTQAKLRLQNMESAVDTMTDITNKMKTLLVQAQNLNQAGDVNLDVEARQALEQVSTLLNTRLDGRYLFAGGRSEAPAVDIDDMVLPDAYFTTLPNITGTMTLAQLGVTAPPPATDNNLVINGNTVDYDDTFTVNDLIDAINVNPPATASLRADPGNNTMRLVIEDLSGDDLAISEGGLSLGNLFDTLDMTNAPNPRADTSYYQGDQQQLNARVDREYDISYGILADDPAFESLIRSLQIMSSTTDPTSLNIAMGHLDNAIKNLPNVQSKIGIDISNIERYENQHKDFRVFASQAITDIESVDVPLTMIELEQHRTALQASFLAISRSSEISLVNYLR
ncbi:flagellin [Thalassospira sp.]|uniref:flagellin N-terminal helical domain-containing protein n=1 Tax=Thalassospira sp. TaxID=1912094 RepID=UPI002734B25E|nr:flagellin [Thalassospira sp.]MDP2696661.1 flagellin [Thalassospira sp.]